MVGTDFITPFRYGFAAGAEAGSGASPKISAAMRLVSIAAGTPQYIATSNRTSCTCPLVQPFANAPLAWTRNSAGLLLLAGVPATSRTRIMSREPGTAQYCPPNQNGSSVLNGAADLS